jgi:hypothetical protein
LMSGDTSFWVVTEFVAHAKVLIDMMNLVILFWYSRCW